MPLWSHFSPSTYFTFKLPDLPGKCFCALSYLASPSCVLCLGKQKTLCVPALLQVLHHYLFLGRHHLSKCDPVAAHLYELHTTWSAVFCPSQKSETLCNMPTENWLLSLLSAGRMPKWMQLTLKSTLCHTAPGAKHGHKFLWVELRLGKSRTLFILRWDLISLPNLKWFSHFTS